VILILNACGAVDNNSPQEQRKVSKSLLSGSWRESHIEVKSENPRQVRMVEENRQRLFLFSESAVNIYDPVTKTLLCSTDQPYSVQRDVVIHVESQGKCPANDWGAQQLVTTQINIEQDIQYAGTTTFAAVAITKIQPTAEQKKAFCGNSSAVRSSALLAGFCR